MNTNDKDETLCRSIWQFVSGHSMYNRRGEVAVKDGPDVNEVEYDAQNEKPNNWPGLGFGCRHYDGEKRERYHPLQGIKTEPVHASRSITSVKRTVGQRVYVASDVCDVYTDRQKQRTGDSMYTKPRNYGVETNRKSKRTRASERKSVSRKRLAYSVGCELEHAA
jgi:hypothetical protein